MAEESNDVNSVPVVTEPSVTQPVAPAEGETTAPPAEEQSVPYERFKEVNDAKNALETQVNQQNQAAMAANATQPQPQATSQEEQIKAYLTSRGIDPEYATPTQMTQVFMEIQGQYSQTIQNQIEDQRLMSEISDFGTVVGSPNALNGQFLPAQPLNQYVQKHPEQSQIIMQNLQTAQGKRLVYQAVVADPDYRKAQLDTTTVPKVAKEAQAMIDNANSIASISNASSASSMDKTAALTAMSPEEFQAHKDSVIARA